MTVEMNKNYVNKKEVMKYPKLLHSVLLDFPELKDSGHRVPESFDLDTQGVPESFDSRGINFPKSKDSGHTDSLEFEDSGNPFLVDCKCSNSLVITY